MFNKKRKNSRQPEEAKATLEGEQLTQEATSAVKATLTDNPEETHAATSEEQSDAEQQADAEELLDAEQPKADEEIEAEEDSAAEQQPDTEEEPTVEQEPAGEQRPEISASALEEAYCLGAGIDAGSLAKAKELLAGIAETVNSGRFSPDNLNLALRMLNIEKLIEEARNEGLAMGRNAKITEAFRNKRNAAAQAASIPHLHGSKSVASPLANSIFEVARGS